MMKRDYIGKTFKAIRADDLRLGDQVVIYDITTGLYQTTNVGRLTQVGDDVEVNMDWAGISFSTSQGNTVLVEVKEDGPN